MDINDYQNKLTLAVHELLRILKNDGYMTTRNVLVEIMGEDFVKQKEREWYRLDEE